VILHAAQPGKAEPAYLQGLHKAGWPVVEMVVTVDFATEKEQAGRLLEKVNALRGQGYSRIVLAGEGFGAWVALLANASFESPEQGAGLAAVIAVDASVTRYVAGNEGQWHDYKFINLLKTQDPTRLALFLYDTPRDELSERRDEVRHSLSDPTQMAFIAVEPREMAAAVEGPDFAKRYGGCLLALLDEKNKTLPAVCAP